MNQTEKARWERTRRKGMWRYVSIRAVEMTVIFLVLWVILAVSLSSRELDLQWFLLRIPALLAGSFLGALARWRFNEGKYYSHQDQDELE
jgi:membrane protease YdiL (CAAX protease family)